MPACFRLLPCICKLDQTAVSRQWGANATSGRVSLARPSRHWLGSSRSSGSLRTAQSPHPNPGTGPWPCGMLGYLFLQAQERSLQKEPDSKMWDISVLHDVFFLSPWKGGQSPSRWGTIQPTRDKEATSQKCSGWVGIIRQRRKEPHSLPTSRDTVSSLSTQASTWGVGGPGCSMN